MIGENGSGKSSLLSAIAMAAGMNPEGGSSNYRRLSRKPRGHGPVCGRITTTRSASPRLAAKRRYIRRFAANPPQMILIAGSARRQVVLRTQVFAFARQRPGRPLAPPPLKDENPWCRRAEVGEAWCGS
ncbi:MAG TPA: hypothetical protein VFI54_02375 [Solirubrobacteraceae bacterium]|nr:hypothetical protein [Solirubrobacteraceae bacterium]